MELGTAVKTIRKKKGFTQKELATMCSISTNALCSIENNKTIPSRSTLNKICESLSVPNAYLLFLCITDEDIPAESNVLFKALYEPMKKVLLEDISK
ncbi:MAG: helix-turn-helix transcriptional regulator [Parabacteroides distasonis]|nr:helix-turn-helix transcriptional regulator [Parabacteroides distasonis]